MLFQRRRAVKTVAPTLFATEKAIDAALQSCVQLSGDLLSARASANLSASQGHAAYER